MSLSKPIGNRFFWGILCGLTIGHLTGGPAPVLAQARTSLASLQSAIDGLINAVIPAGNALKLEGYSSSAFYLRTDAIPAEAVAGSLPASSIPTQLDNKDLQSPRILPAGLGASAETVGVLRFNTAENALQVSDGTQWRTLAYAP